MSGSKLLKQKEFFERLANSPGASVFVSRFLIDIEKFSPQLAGWAMGFSSDIDMVNLSTSNGSLRTFKSLASAEKLLLEHDVESFTVYTGY